MKKLITLLVFAILFLGYLGPVNAGAKEGTAAWLSKDYQKTLSEFMPLAKNGDANAQFMIGYLHYFGYGMNKDLKEAAYWYKKSAAKGVPIAQYWLGEMYLTGKGGLPKNYQQALELFKEADEQEGFPLAQHNLGIMYLRGEGVPQNNKKAINYFTKASAQGLAESQLKLGFMYRTGKGVVQNTKKGVDLYKKSAKQGFAEAQHNLGVMYYSGTGVWKNKKTAAKWYTKAAEQGYTNSQYNLGVLYLGGEGVEQSFTKAAYWIKKARQQGHKLADEAWDKFELWKY